MFSSMFHFFHFLHKLDMITHCVCVVLLVYTVRVLGISRRVWLQVLAYPLLCCVCSSLLSFVLWSGGQGHSHNLAHVECHSVIFPFCSSFLCCYSMPILLVVHECMCVCECMYSVQSFDLLSPHASKTSSVRVGDGSGIISILLADGERPAPTQRQGRHCLYTHPVWLS